MSKEPIQFDNGTFSYDGVKYILDVRFQYTIGDEEGGISLTTSKIQDLEICTSIDKLYSEGFVIYRDVTGDIQRMGCTFQPICNIVFMEYQQDWDGDFGAEDADDSNIGNLENGTAFSHTFIVDNIEIVDNDSSSVTYCIYFTGKEFTGLLNHVSYSDYGLEEKKNLVQIVKDILVGFSGNPIDDSFDEIQSGIFLSYVSNGNDTVKTSIEYLMQKQFFYHDGVDNTMKFLLYDFVAGTYGIYQPGVSKVEGMHSVILSMNYSEIEEFISEDEVELATESDVKTTDMLYPISTIRSRSYGLEQNQFQVRDFSSSEVSRFFGGNRVSPFTSEDKSNIVRDVSEWNNDVNVYSDFVKSFMSWDSVIVNTGGVIGRKLMSVMDIEVDSRVEMSYDDTTESVDENFSRYGQLAGPWYVTKIRYIIRPNDSVFKQNIRLSRTNIEAV